MAIVAVATVWSGFQASQWDSEQSLLYGQASRDPFEAEAASTLAGQELSADSAMFTAWLQAHSAGNTVLETEMEHRFHTRLPQGVRRRWFVLDPFMIRRRHRLRRRTRIPLDPNRGEGQQADWGDASERFDKGTEASETGDKYVRDTVLFASVLFFVAIGQRFKSHAARLCVQFGELPWCSSTRSASVATLPRVDPFGSARALFVRCRDDAVDLERVERVVGKVQAFDEHGTGVFGEPRSRAAYADRDCRDRNGAAGHPHPGSTSVKTPRSCRPRRLGELRHGPHLADEESEQVEAGFERGEVGHLRAEITEDPHRLVARVGVVNRHIRERGSDLGEAPVRITHECRRGAVGDGEDRVVPGVRDLGLRRNPASSVDVHSSV